MTTCIIFDLLLFGRTQKHKAKVSFGSASAFQILRICCLCSGISCWYLYFSCSLRSQCR